MCRAIPRRVQGSRKTQATRRGPVDFLAQYFSVGYSSRTRGHLEDEEPAPGEHLPMREECGGFPLLPSDTRLFWCAHVAQDGQPLVRGRISRGLRSYGHDLCLPSPNTGNGGKPLHGHLLDVRFHGPEWLTGGPRGTEASLARIRGTRSLVFSVPQGVPRRIAKPQRSWLGRIQMPTMESSRCRDTIPARAGCVLGEGLGVNQRRNKENQGETENRNFDIGAHVRNTQNQDWSCKASRGADLNRHAP